MSTTDDGTVRTTSSLSGSSNTGVSRYYKYGKLRTTSGPFMDYGTYVPEHVERSSIAKTVIDSTGWREPLPYSASGRKSKPLTGRCHHGRPLDAEYNTGSTDYSYPSWTEFWAEGDNLGVSHWNHMETPSLQQPEFAFPGWLEQRAINRALGDLKDSKVNYAVMLAESRKASSLVATTAKTIFYALRDVKRGKMKRAADRFGLSRKNFKDTFKLYKGKRGFDRQMSNRWLELQYGWTPLLADIYGVVEDINSGFLREPRFAVTKTSMHTVNDTHQLAGGSSYWTRDATTVAKYLVKVRLDYVIDIGALQTLAQKGVTNPASVAWELTPWSFVVDWFTPIGEYLNTLDAATGLSFKGGTVTRFERVKTTAALKFSVPGTHSSGECDGFIETWDMSRRVLNTSPSGGLYFSNPFSARRALSAIALLNTTLNLTQKR